MPYYVAKKTNFTNFSKHTMMMMIMSDTMLQSVQTSCSPHLAYSEFRSCWSVAVGDVIPWYFMGLKSLSHRVSWNFWDC